MVTQRIYKWLKISARVENYKAAEELLQWLIEQKNHNNQIVLSSSLEIS